MQRYKRIAGHPDLCYHCVSRRSKLSRRVDELKNSSHQDAWCDLCSAEVSEKDAVFWMCVDCGYLFCDVICGSCHINDHWEESNHPLAILLDNVNQVYCFPCESFRPTTVNIEDEVPRKIENKVGVPWHKSDVAAYTVKMMPNHGNSCFFNSTLQNLLALHKLPLSVSRLNPVGDITKSLQRLIQDEHSDEFVLDPKQLLNAVFTATQQFQIGVQHDSHEFLQYFINELGKEDLDVLDQTFRGRLSSTVSCTQCAKKSVQHEHFLDLSLEVPSKIRLTKADDGNAPKADVPSSSRDKNDDKDTVILGVKDSSSIGINPGPSQHIDLNSPPSVNNSPTFPSDENSPLTEQCTRRYTPVNFSLEVPSKIRPTKTDDGNAPKADVLSPSRDKDDNKDTVIFGVKDGSRKDVSPGPNQHVDLNSPPSVNYSPTVPSEELPENSPLTEQCSRRYPPASAVTTGKMFNTQKPKSKWIEEHHLSADKEDANAGKEKFSGSEVVCDPKVSTGETCNAGADSQPVFKMPKSVYNGESVAAHEKETCEVDDSGGPLSVEVCLKLFTREENLPESKCEHCAHNEKCKRLLICKAPPILAIHLKRFCQNARGTPMKVEGHIHFRELLDLTPYMDPEHVADQVLTYRLRGIVEHIGSTMACGHYVAYVRRQQNRVGRYNDDNPPAWFVASDMDVEKVTLLQVLQREAYILFFERIPR